MDFWENPTKENAWHCPLARYVSCFNSPLNECSARGGLGGGTNQAMWDMNCLVEPMKTPKVSVAGGLRSNLK